MIANHFGSKGGDQPLHGRYQPPSAQLGGPSGTRRPRRCNTFVKQLLAADRNANVVVLGDINDFEFSPVTADLTERRGLRPLIKPLRRSSATPTSTRATPRSSTRS